MAKIRTQKSVPLRVTVGELGVIQIAWIDLHTSFPDVAEQKEVLNPVCMCIISKLL